MVVVQNNSCQSILKIRDYSLFNSSPGEESIKTHPRVENHSNKQKTQETQSGLKGLCPQEGEPTGTKDKEKTRIVEPLKFFNQLCDMENSLLKVFNKLNDIQYVNGIVNLSKYKLTKSETNVLSKGLGFSHTPGAPDIGNIIQDLDVFKERQLQNEQFYEEPTVTSLERSYIGSIYL